MELLEYLIQVRGAAAAGAQVRGLAGEMNQLAASQRRVGASGDAAAAGSEKMAASMGLVGKVAKVGALGLAAIGLEAVKMSIGFNHEMLRIRTDAGASSKELAYMKVHVLDLAQSGASLGAGPNSLAQGLYHIESLNIRGAKALHALTLSAQEAAISGASLEQTTTALGAAMFVGIKGAGGLDQIMGILNATVGSGNMRFAQLIEGLGTGVLGSFKAAKLSIQDMSAAIATLTDAGYPASSAAAQLATSLHFLSNPGMKASGALDSVGLSGKKLFTDMTKPKGLLVALRDLHSHLSKLSGYQQQQVVGAVLPGGRGRVLLNLYEQLDRLGGKYKQVAAIQNSFGGSVAQQRKDPGTQLKMGEARMQASLIGIGNVLTPIVLPALAKLLHIGAQVLDWLKNATIWLTKHKDAALALGIGLGVLVAGFVALKVAALASSSALLGSPIGWVILGIAALAAGLVFAYNHFKTFRTVVNAVWSWLKVATASVVTFVGNHWKLLMTVLAIVFFGPIGLAIALVVTHFQWFRKMVTNVWNAIQAVVSSAWNAFLLPIFNAIGAGLHTLGAVFNWLWNNVVKPVWTGISDVVTKAWGIIQPILTTLGSAFQTAFGIVLQVVNAVLAPIQAVVSGINQVGGALNSINPFSGSSSQAQINKGTPAQVQALNNKLKQVGMPQVHQHAAFNSGLTSPLASIGSKLTTPVAALNPSTAAFHVHVESPVYIDGREIARAHRRQVIKAMAAGA